MSDHIVESNDTLLKQCEDMYGQYGRYVNKWRAFPLYEDGLKLVERRVLYSEYLEAREKLTKSALIVGHCMGHFHPHGDSSIYGTLVSLCNAGISDYNGNFGTKIGLHDEPASASRYTEVKMKKAVENMAFQHMNFIPYEELELHLPKGQSLEPVYLASKLPFCLIRGMEYCIGIGFGFKTYIPSYKKEDLIKRLKWLITKEGAEPIIKPVTDCILDNTDDVYKQLLTTGKAKVMYRGKAKMDKVNKCIIVNSISPSKKWDTILNKFKDEIQVQKSIGYIDESYENKTEVRFQILKRGQNLEKIFKTIQNCISGLVSFTCNMCDRDGNVKVVSIDQMLLRAYEVYKEANKKMLEFNINKCQQIIDELNLVARVKKVLPKWLKQCPDDIDELIKGVQQDTTIDLEVLKSMFEKYTIPKFVRCKTDTTQVQNKKLEQENYLNHLDNFVWRLYELL